MSADPEAPVTEPDTPTTPEADTPAEVDYRKRYEDLQPEYTRTTQELAQARKVLNGEDEDGVRELLERLGYELDDEDDEPDDTPATQQAPPAADDPRITQLLAAEQQRAAREAEQQFRADFDKAIGDREVNDKARKWIENTTIANGNNPEALKAAVDEWFELTTPAAPKQRVARAATGGTAPNGPDKPWEDMTSNERAAAMTARLQAEQH